MAKEDGIRFFGLNDGKTYTNIPKVVDFIDDFESEKEDFTLAEIIGIYNAFKFLKILKKEEKIKINKKFGKFSDGKISSYFDMKQLSELNSEYKELTRLCQQDFWEVFLKCNAEEQATMPQLQAFVSENNIDVKNLMNQKSNCDDYNRIVKTMLLKEPKNVELFLEKCNSCSEVNYEFPTDFSKPGINPDIDAWVVRYCKLPDAKEEYLRQIWTWSEKHTCKFDDMTKATAKKALKERSEAYGENADGIQTVIQSIIKSTQFPFVTQNYEELLESLMVVLCFNDNPGCFPLIRYNNRQEMKKTKYSYSENIIFIMKKTFCINRLRVFCDRLSSEAIEVEDILAFNYQEPLKRKYLVDGFKFKPTTKGADYYDKIKGLNPEMDRILKQYSVYKDYGVIDEDVLDIRSYNPDYRDLKSLSEKKFVYAHAADVLVFCNLLFHDETDLSVLHNEFESVSFYEYVKNGARIADLDDYKKDVFYGNPYLNNLLGVDNSGGIFFRDLLKIEFYKTLWEYGYYPLFHAPDSLLQFIDTEEKSGKLKCKDTLFSQQEINYISYMLDVKFYDNGPDIRNRGAHGLLPDGSVVKCEDYYLNLLIIFLLYTVRIIEELEHQNKKEATEGDAG